MKYFLTILILITCISCYYRLLYIQQEEFFKVWVRIEIQKDRADKIEKKLKGITE